MRSMLEGQGVPSNLFRPVEEAMVFDAKYLRKAAGAARVDIFEGLGPAHRSLSMPIVSGLDWRGGLPCDPALKSRRRAKGD